MYKIVEDFQNRNVTQRQFQTNYSLPPLTKDLESGAAGSKLHTLPSLLPSPKTLSGVELSSEVITSQP